MGSEPLFPLHHRWEVMPLGEVCRRGGGNVQTGPFGSQLHASDYVSDGIPSVMPQNIGDNKILYTGIAKITREDAERLSKYRMREGDIVYSRRGDVERRALVRKTEDGWLCGTGCLRIRFGDEFVYPRYAAHYLGHPSVREWIVRHAHGATMPNLNTTILSELPFVLPPWSAQVLIGDAIEAYDRKLDLNRRINQTLEAMAQAIFQSWFVNFDPVKAKVAAIQEGRDPLRAAMTAVSGKADAELDALPPEQYEQLAATAALFPDEMEASELGGIPKGWAVCPLPECVGINPARALKKGAVAPYLDMANVPTNAARVDNVITRAFGSGSKFINGDTLLARITPCLENGKTAYVDFLADGEVGWGSTEFIVLRPKVGLPLPFAYFLCRHPEFRAFAISQMAGTSGRQRVPNDCFGSYKVVKPSVLIAEAFGKQTTQFMRQIKSLDEESKTLAGLRDALLPRLLSGELQVPHAEAEAVA